ncbi:DNA translocase FtsK [Chromobacterium vaccinii]|uniref:DNA translocase FtsK n=1 Tax=Chromobacterium vaccinii TaxID=1108595 RepID=UPI000E17460B|nr:Ftsk gamma domain [Chromobacterium vaccinii]
MTDLYQQAVELVIRTQRCGIHHVATSLGCFFYDAATMLCRMEHEGIVSQYQDGYRKVLKQGDAA